MIIFEVKTQRYIEELYFLKVNFDDAEIFNFVFHLQFKHREMWGRGQEEKLYIYEILSHFFIYCPRKFLSFGQYFYGLRILGHVKN